ncbi:virescein-like [Spodoptera litura]|uniref:Moricin n=1 Tax=Spodoptera litura TaxID=69820 RepID=Q7YZB4_SPOLT|nr:virescein-like [Spodoptera litura]BAC79440.1 moricin [Spodoptera litura]
MKLTKVFVILIVVVALLVPSEAAPGKIPVKAIKKAGAAIGKGLRAINIASTAHDVYSFFKPKHKKKH